MHNIYIYFFLHIHVNIYVYIYVIDTEQQVVLEFVHLSRGKVIHNHTCNTVWSIYITLGMTRQRTVSHLHASDIDNSSVNENRKTCEGLVLQNKA